MALLGKWFVIGSMVLFCYGGVSANNLIRIRRQDFVFPDEVLSFYNRGHLQNQQQQFQQQLNLQQQLQSEATGGFFQPQTRGFFPIPNEFSFSNQNSFQIQSPNRFVNQFQPDFPQQRTQTRADLPPPQQPAAVIPDAVATTPSPRLQACIEQCPTTSEYNPICGTNRQLYTNQQKFDCAVRCGARVEVWRRGSCEGLFTMMRG